MHTPGKGMCQNGQVLFEFVGRSVLLFVYFLGAFSSLQRDCLLCLPRLHIHTFIKFDM
jgi:hypothetical protein